MKTWKKIVTYALIIAMSCVSAISYTLFVFPNKFAPSGLNGICTMIQYVTGVTVSSMNLLINLPLAFLVYKKVSKPIAIRSMVYVLGFSAAPAPFWAPWLRASSAARSTPPWPRPAPTPAALILSPP